MNNNNETGGSEKQEDTPGEKEGHSFEYNGVQIGINDEAAPILECTW